MQMSILRSLFGRPVFKSAITSCVVMTAGDFLCQTIQRRDSSPQKPHDWWRTARFGVVGLTLHGPFFHYGFKAIDKVLGTARTMKSALVKTCSSHFTIFPTYITSFFLYMGILEQRGAVGGVQKVQQAFWPTFTVGTAFWPAAIFLNFMYCPPQYRVAYIGVMGIAWNSYLSWSNQHYTPAKEVSK